MVLVDDVGPKRTATVVPFWFASATGHVGRHYGQEPVPLAQRLSAN